MSLTKEESFKILELYKSWNVGQKSISKSFGGAHTEEDNIYDKRRELIKKAYEVLNES